MIEELLPATVVAVETYDDETGDGAYGAGGLGVATLYPEEQELVSRAVPKRVREFTLVRVCPPGHGEARRVAAARAAR